VRIALGAQRWRVVGRVMAEGARLAVAGAGAGLLGSVVVARWLAQATVTAGAPTVWTWVAAAAILAGAVTVASVLPARRSVMLNPFRTR
jgi:ABC-type antimicrobial peptide transport system permease subunit